MKGKTYARLALALVCFFSTSAIAQDVAKYGTFSTTRVINGHSVETLGKKKLDIRITHRFGDIGGDNGGVHNLYGLDNSSDIRIAGEYGISDKLMIGAGRSKGASIKESYDFFGKYQFLNQGKKPISASVVSTMTISGQKASTDPTSAFFYDGFADRLYYTTQLLLARKFGDRFSAQLIPGYHHRNLVAFGDDNGLLSVGISSRLKITKVMGLSIEYFHVLASDRNINGVEYVNPLAIGLEFDTGGHVFQIDFTNAGGIGENQFIAQTTQKWDEGQYRIGFTISRPFKL